MKILMVCLGNICRSPLAEGILKKKAETRNLDWEIESAGTSSFHNGELPDSRSIAVAKAHGINITDQRSRLFLKEDLDEFDLILAMDSSNYQNIVRMASNETQKRKVKLIMNYEKPGYNQAVPDPYWNSDGFEGVFQMLDRACEKIVEEHS